ncbi:MAG: hypothetical protein MI867_14320, partial [Pseudomonadales bacterium]|nr:hypothetical protein [Pseudomonadales bacterium]
GVGTAFSSAMKRMAPAFERLQAAFENLGQAFGFLSDGAADSLDPLSSAGRTGARVGNMLARMFERIVDGTTFVVTNLADFTRGFKGALEFFGPVFDEMSAAFTRLTLAMARFEGDSAANFRRATEGSGGMAEGFGNAFGAMVAFVADGITTLVNFVTFIVNFARTVNFQIQKIDIFFSRLAIRVVSAWMNIVDGIKNALDLIMIAIGDAASLIPETLRTPEIQMIVDQGARAEDTFRQRQVSGQVRSARRSNALSRLSAREQEIQTEARIREQADQELVRGVEEALERRREGERRALRPEVKVIIDGAEVAKAGEEASREDMARGFGSAPSETGA